MSELAPSFWELAVQATTNTRHGYNLLAPKFEQTAYATPSELIEACRARVDHLFPVSRSLARGADLACGTGRASRILFRSCAQVQGYDFSQGMLEEARKSSTWAAGLSFVEADLAKFSLERECFQRITIFGAWGHILPSWRSHFFHQLTQALAPEGVFYTVCADPVGPSSLAWWRAAMFDTTLKLRNRLLGDPFHMYYLLNDTLSVKSFLEDTGQELEVRLEPLPRYPHPRLTLLMARRIPVTKRP